MGYLRTAFNFEGTGSKKIFERFLGGMAALAEERPVFMLEVIKSVMREQRNAGKDGHCSAESVHIFTRKTFFRLPLYLEVLLLSRYFFSLVVTNCTTLAREQLKRSCRFVVWCWLHCLLRWIAAFSAQGPPYLPDNS